MTTGVEFLLKREDGLKEGCKPTAGAEPSPSEEFDEMEMLLWFRRCFLTKFLARDGG